MPSPFLRSRDLEAEAALIATGRFEDARESLGSKPGAAPAIARAWTALAQHNPADALLHAGRACEQVRDPTDLLMARAARATACALLGRPIERFNARDMVGVDPALLPEALLEIARACTAARDLPGAQRWLALAEPSEPNVLARYLLLRAELAGTESNFRQQSQLAAEALHCIEPHAGEEAVLFREAARTRAALARELPGDDRDVFSRIAQSGAADDRTRCEALRAHAWLMGLHGEYERALASVMQATRYLRTPLQHLALHADIAAIAVMNGDAHAPFAQAALETAVASASAIRWEEVAPDDLLVIPHLLQTAAEMHREQIARSCEELAERVFQQHHSQIDVAACSPFAALLHEAHAFAYAHKDESAALRHAREAYAAFESFGYDWRAGRIALFVYQLTGLRDWDQRAKRHLRAYPASRIYHLLDAGGTQRLTRRQQEVLDAVLHGKSIVQIAVHLRISEETVRKHLGPIMRHFGVKTRIELLAKVRRHSSDHVATFQKSETTGSGSKP